MKIPNWQHHSKKEPKRTLKPQALRQARARLQNIKKRYYNPSKRGVSSYYVFIPNEIDGSQARNQVTTGKVACY